MTALLSRNRQRIDKKIENDFPYLPPECSIQLERVAREHILSKIKSVLNDLRHFIPETIQTWEHDNERPLDFGNFIEATGLPPVDVLKSKSWSEWKALAANKPPPDDPDIQQGRKALSRLALRTDPNLLDALKNQVEEQPCTTYNDQTGTALHYLMWGQNRPRIGVSSLAQSLAKWRQNKTLFRDAAEIATWKQRTICIPQKEIQLPFPCSLKLHAAYGLAEIKAALGLATLNRSGPTGSGVLHCHEKQTYVHLVTFRKEERDFSPTTLYKDYPTSRNVLLWESQSTTTQNSPTGQNDIHFKDHGYTILFFARLRKKIDGETAPFYYLGPAEGLIDFKGNRPIAMTSKLTHPMPAQLYEEARAA